MSERALGAPYRIAGTFVPNPKPLCSYEPAAAASTVLHEHSYSTHISGSTSMARGRVVSRLPSGMHAHLRCLWSLDGNLTTSRRPPSLPAVPWYKSLSSLTWHVHTTEGEDSHSTTDTQS